MYRDLAAVRFHDLAADVEAEPEAVDIPRLLGALEPLENLPYVFRIDADTVILNLEQGELAALPGLNVNGLAATVANRVGKKVDDDLLDAVAVPETIEVAGYIHGKIASRQGDLGGDPFGHFLDQIRQAHLALIQGELSRIDTGHVEHVFDQPGEAVYLLARYVEIFLETVGQAGIEGACFFGHDSLIDLGLHFEGGERSF